MRERRSLGLALGLVALGLGSGCAPLGKLTPFLAEEEVRSIDLTILPTNPVKVNTTVGLVARVTNQHGVPIGNGFPVIFRVDGAVVSEGTGAVNTAFGQATANLVARAVGTFTVAAAAGGVVQTAQVVVIP